MPNCWLKSLSQLNDTLPPIDVDACWSVSFPIIILHRFFHFFQSGRCKIMLWWWCSVTQSCPTLCDPMDYSMPGFCVLHSPSPGACSNLYPLRRWCHLTILPSAVPISSCLQSFPASTSFPTCQFFASGGQSIGASASASVLPMNIQDWFPLGLTGFISLQSKGLSRVFSSATVQKNEFFSAQPSLWSNSNICTWLLEKP